MGGRKGMKRNISKRILAALTAGLITITGMPAQVYAASADLIADIEQSDISKKSAEEDTAKDIEDTEKNTTAVDAKDNTEEGADADSADGSKDDSAEDAAEDAADDAKAITGDTQEKIYDESANNLKFDDSDDPIEHDRAFYEFEYENIGDSYRVSKFVMKTDVELVDDWGFTGHIEVPGEHEGLPVTSIGSHAFDSLEMYGAYLFFPPSIEVFEENAFQGLNVQFLIIDFPSGSGLTSIGNYAFNGSGINEFNVPASVRTIGEYAFLDCQNLYRVTFEEGSSLESIGSGAFQGCEMLHEFEFPSSSALSRIESYTFANSGVSIIGFPSNIEYIGQFAFYRTNIESIGFEAYTSDKGLIIDNYAFCESGVRTAVLPDEIIRIGSYAFFETPLSTVVSVSESNCNLDWCEDHDLKHCIHIADLGVNAFSSTDIKKLKVGVEGTSDELDGYTGLLPPIEELVFDGSTIPAYLCWGNSRLQKVTFLRPVDYVGKEAFHHCDTITGIEFPEIDNDYPNNGLYIGDGAFSECSSLEKINLPDGLDYIGEKAFENCSKLGIPELPDSVYEIGNNAFTGILDFSVTRLPANLNRVGQHVFEGCTALKNTPLPDKLRSVAAYSFADIPYEELVIPKGLTVEGGYAFTGAKKIVFEEGTVTIPGYICLGCSALNNVVIPNTVTDIGRCAFKDCNSLTGIILPDGLTTVGIDAFRGCGSLTSVTIPGNVKELDFKTFAECTQLKKVTIKNGMQTIGGGAFSDCTSLTSVSLPGTLRTIDYDAFKGCSSLSDIALPDGVTTIGYSAFENTDLVVVEIPKSVSTITRWNSYGPEYWTPFTSVRKMIFADGTTTIPAGIAYKAAELEEIVIPKSVTTISNNAFYNCSRLAYVYYEGTEDDWRTVAKYNNANLFDNATVIFESKGTGNDAVIGVAVKPASVILSLSDKKQLYADVLPKSAGNRFVTWSSKNPSIAEVNKDGWVTPKKYGKTQIVAKTLEGGYEAVCDVEVTNNIPVLNSFELSGGSGTFAVDDDIPFFGGKEFSLDLPVELPVNFVLEDNKIKIGINIARKSLYSYNSTEGVTTSTYHRKSIKEQFEDFKKDALTGSLLARDEDWLKSVRDKSFTDAKLPAVEQSVNFNAVGYLEAYWSGDNRVQKVQGTLILTFKASETSTSGWLVMGVPVTVMCTLSANGQITADVGYNFEEAKFYGDVELLASFGIELYGGVGVGDWISLGVYGKADTAIKIALHINSSSEKQGLQEWTINGEAGLKAYFAKKSASIKMVDGTYYIFPAEKNKKSASKDDLLGASAEIEDEILTVKNLLATDSIQNNAVGSNGILVEDAYNAANPVIASSSSGQLLFYVADDTSRSLLNQSQLVYSIYDPVNNTYSDAKPVLPENNTADYDPEIFADGSDIYVAWLDSDRLFTDADALREDTDSLDEYVKSFRVHVAKYNSADDTFEDLGGPAESLSFSSNPRLFMDNGKLQLAWVENKNDTMIYTTGADTSVYWCEYDNGSWSVRDEVGGLNSVSTIGFAEDGNGAYLAYAVEKDTDPKTEGQDLFIRKNSASSKIAEGAFTNLSYTQLPGVSGKAMAVNAKGALKYVSGGSLSQLLPEGTMNVSSRFYTVGDKVLYIVSGEESRNIAVSAYDNGEWGQALLTHDSAYIDFVSVASGTICYLYSDVVPAGDGTFDASSSIRVLTTGDYNDTELELADFALDDAYPGANLPVSLYIRNNGTSRIDKAHVSVTYGETELGSGDIDVSIMPGATGEYPYEFVIPEKLTAGSDIEVTVTTAGDEVPDNNTKEISLSMADLEVMSSYDDSGETPVITIMVENRGLKSTGMEMTVSDEEGNVLFTEYGTVKAGSFVRFEKDYTLETKQILTIEVSSDEDELYTMNNITWQEVGKDNTDPGNDPDPDSEPETEDVFSVRFTGTASDPYEGLSFNKDAGEKGRYEAVYTGKAVRPAVAVYGYNRKLKEGIDYTVKYTNNTAVSAKKPAKVTVTGKGSFTGKNSLEFYIIPADLAVLREKNLIKVPEEIKVQSGKKVNPVILYGDYTLKASDMTLSNTGAIKENTAIDVTGKGNFTGTLTGIPVTVMDARAVKNATIKVSVKAGTHIYDGTAQQLTCTGLDDKGEAVRGEITVTAGSSKKPLREGEDYKVIYTPGSNVNAGKVKFTVIGTGDYLGSVSKTFTIAPDKTSEITALLADAEADILHSPAGAAPEVMVTLQRQGQEPLELTKGIDYKISYSNNKKVGTGKYTVNFLGNYKGHKAIKNRTFTIKQAPFTAEAVSADKVYTKPGKYISAPMVTIDGTLLSSRDYEVTYFDGSTPLTSKSKLTLEEGAASKEITVKVRGKGNYLGDEITTTYRVIRMENGMYNLSKAKIVAADQVKGKDVSVGKQVYTGAEVKPDIRVLIKNGKNWTEVGSDSYSVEYVNNVNIGSATILVKGDGIAAVGSKSCKFSIGKRSFNIFSILFGKIGVTTGS